MMTDDDDDDPDHSSGGGSAVNMVAMDGDAQDDCVGYENDNGPTTTMMSVFVVVVMWLW